MEKTKLGISVALMAVIAYLVAGFGGYVPLLLVVGYILLREDSTWLKKNAVKALGLLLIFSVAFFALDLIPNLFGILSNFLEIFGSSLPYNFTRFFTKVFNFLTSILALLRSLLFIALALFSLKGKSIPIPVLDPALDKLFD